MGVRCICVPVPDDAEWIAKFYGAIYTLSQQIWWDRDEAHTAKVVAARWLEVYLEAMNDPCGGGLPCEVPADPRFGLELIIKLIRKGVGGFTEMWDGFEWGPPTGDIEVPPMPVRTEPDRLCLAARNAANVLDVTYEEATDSWNIEHTELALWNVILDGLISLVGAFAGPTAVAYATYAKSITDIFVEGFDAIADDVWTPEFTEELTCLFYEFASDDAGVITFDFDAINERLIELQAAAIVSLNENRALLISQVGYLLFVIAADGLNHAGATTAITEYDCSCVLPWCYSFDFSVSNGGWAVTPSPGGGVFGDAVYANNGATFGTHVAAAYWAGEFKDWSQTTTDFRQGVDIRIFFTADAHIDSVTIFYDKVSGVYPLTNIDYITVGPTGTNRAASSAPAGLQTWVYSPNVDVLSGQFLRVAMTNHRDFSSPYVNSGYIRILGVEVRGHGDNPFGLDNCV